MGGEPTLSWALERPADQHAGGVATIDLGTGERRTWTEVAGRVHGLASGLMGLGLDHGDRVGLLMLNSARHFELWFAIPAAGMVMNDLNYRLAVEELAFICTDSDVRVLFVDDTYLETGRRLVDQVESLTTLVWTGPGSDAPEGTVAYESLVATAPAKLPDQSHDQVAAIFYTGGTTGLPKGAMLTHRNLTANAIHTAGLLNMTHRDRYLHAGPQFHLADGAMTFALSWAGGTHVFVPAFEPNRVVAALADERCTLALLVPTMLGMVLPSGALDGADLSALRTLMYGASPMPAEVQRRVQPRAVPDHLPHLVLGLDLHHQLRHQPVEAGVGAPGQQAQRVGDQPLGGNSRLQFAVQQVVGRFQHDGALRPLKAAPRRAADR